MVEKLLDNWVLKLISLAFAVVLWFFVMGESRMEVTHVVPLQYERLPKGLMIANEVPTSVAVRISGPRTLLVNLNPSDINLRVDLYDLSAGVTSFKRLEESLNLPGGLKVTRISPSFVDVKLEKVRDKDVPVRSLFVGQPAEGFLVAESRTIPPKVVVSGAESELKGVSEVVTEQIDLSNVRENFTQTVALDYSGVYTSLQDAKTVDVQVVVQPDPNYVPPAAESTVVPDGTSPEKAGKP